MANKQDRSVKRAIKETVKKVKRGELPVPPKPKKASPAEEAQTLRELRARAKSIRTELARLESDGSRAAHKKRLRLHQELDRITEVLG